MWETVARNSGGFCCYAFLSRVLQVFDCESDARGAAVRITAAMADGLYRQFGTHDPTAIGMQAAVGETGVSSARAG